MTRFFSIALASACALSWPTITLAPVQAKPKPAHVKHGKPLDLPTQAVPPQPRPAAIVGDMPAPVDRSVHVGGVTITPGGYLGVGGRIGRD